MNETRKWNQFLLSPTPSASRFFSAQCFIAPLREKKNNEEIGARSCACKYSSITINVSRSSTISCQSLLLHTLKVWCVLLLLLFSRELALLASPNDKSFFFLVVEAFFRDAISLALNSIVRYNILLQLAKKKHRETRFQVKICQPSMLRCCVYCCCSDNAQ